MCYISGKNVGFLYALVLFRHKPNNSVLIGKVRNHIVYSPLHELSKTHSCPFCGAKRLQHEPSTFCCYNGKVVLSIPQIPKDLYILYTSHK